MVPGFDANMIISSKINFITDITSSLDTNSSCDDVISGECFS